MFSRPEGKPLSEAPDALKLPGNLPAVLAKVRERLLLPAIRGSAPDVVDLHLPAFGGTDRYAFVSFRKTFPHHARQVAAALWGLRTLTFVIEVVPTGLWLPWRLAYHASTGGFIVVMTMLALRLAGIRKPWVERALWLYWLAGPLWLLVVIIHCSAACTKPEPESEAISRSLAIRARKDTEPVPMPTRRTSRPRFSNSLVSLANHNGAMAPSVEP